MVHIMFIEFILSIALENVEISKLGSKRLILSPFKLAILVSSFTKSCNKSNRDKVEEK